MAHNYFIAQGTGIRAFFETLEEMRSYHAQMASIDRHFCKLYDCINKRIANGYEPDTWRDNKSAGIGDM